MDPDYMESVLWCFKRLHDLGLIYEGEKVVAYCTRCQTSLSNFEARLDDATRARQDAAATVRFRLARDPCESLLAWTTTPWTLPANVALALDPEVEYVSLDNGRERVWLAAEATARYQELLAGYEQVDRVAGASLVGLRYRPMFPYFADEYAGAFRAVAADFVETGSGTGVVHLAPAFGEDDRRVCRRNGIRGPNPVRDDGTFDAVVSDFAERDVFAAIPEILRWLREQELLFHRETYDHNYPHCWRCDAPLIYRGVRTWFVEVSAFKDRMLAANGETRWVPDHLRDGRFGDWLANARDWAVSRNRFWGCPLPVWKCAECDAIEVVGSRDELERRSGREVEDLHRPAIDEVMLPCQCGGTLERVSDVLDCWFESGAMPYAQLHYPFAARQVFEDSFPADFIVEYIAQTRGWFYTLVVLSTALFDRAPFKNVVCHGVILAEDGRKMSKRLKNYPDPMELVAEHGSDALRVALLSSAVVRGLDARFSPDSVREAVRKYCLPVWNTLHFFTSYASIDDFEPRGLPAELSRLDQYMLSETDALRSALEDSMAAYDFGRAYEHILDYVGVVSGWYVRLVRSQLWRSGFPAKKRAVCEVLYAALSTFARVVAPFMPFLAEAMHRALGGAGSVHLLDWPEPAPGWRDDALNAEMRGLRLAVRLARRARENHGVKHRHPLPKVAIGGLPAESVARNEALLRDELNVKAVEYLGTTDGLVKTRIKLNFARLGRRLRSEVKAVAAAVDSGQYELLEDGAVLSVAGHRFASDDFSVEQTTEAEGAGVAAEDGVVVVLDLNTTPELVAEGHVRDLNRALQDLRKAAGLHYTDRVDVAVDAPGPLWTEIQPHMPWLAEQLLAPEVRRGVLSEPDQTRDLEVATYSITVSLRRRSSSLA
jgi:isoleucyl-tRNA synthetase